jgi:uncharacterized glyoxalase superfamily protein PhnB
METQISPMLAVNDGNAAIEFYRAAFDATLLWHLDGGEHVVAGLSIDGAKFFIADESPPSRHAGTRLCGVYNREDRTVRERSRGEAQASVSSRSD